MCVERHCQGWKRKRRDWLQAHTSLLNRVTSPWERSHKRCGGRLSACLSLVIVSIVELARCLSDLRILQFIVFATNCCLTRHILSKCAHFMRDGTPASTSSPIPATRLVASGPGCAQPPPNHWCIDYVRTYFSAACISCTRLDISVLPLFSRVSGGYCFWYRPSQLFVTNV
jgi:hypothetical protein